MQLKKSLHAKKPTPVKKPLHGKKPLHVKKPKSISGALATATCALLGTHLPHPAAASEPFKNWEYDSALLYYSEQDRVTAVEPVISARNDMGNDQFLNFKFVVDALSGASANGAVPADKTQTFSGPSGQKSYSVAPNETPLDPTFEDTRFAANVLWEKPTSRYLKALLGANFSTETDYTSLGVSATFTYDANNKNTTLSAGASFSHDTVSPIGGAPDPFTEVPTSSTSGGENEGDDDGEGGEGEGGETKNVTDLLFGVTQVLSRHTLTQFNYSIGQSSGYLTDPYKLLTVVDPVTGDLVPAVDPNNTYRYLHERRPDSRTRQSVYWKTNHQFTDDVVYLTYRYYWDDWDVKSHTVDLRYRYELGRHHYLQPHARYYQQTAANFYRYYLVDGEPLPQYASADYRLGDMTTTTFGLLYGAELGKNSEFTFRAEYMKQSNQGYPADAIGKLRDYNLSPDVKAIILQASYNVKF
ncbi:MAG: DUF3570 domain-containing protein [Gammaproteobacteria bacterium]|jgi:hypothetical protein